MILHSVEYGSKKDSKVVEFSLPQYYSPPFKFHSLQDESGAVVVSGFNERIGKSVAIIVVREGLLVNAEINTKYYDMIRGFKHFRHPNLIILYDCFVASKKMEKKDELKTSSVKQVLLVTDLFDISLREIINRSQKKLEVGFTKQCIFSILKALAYFHQSGMAHKEIRPVTIKFSKKTGEFRLSSPRQTRPTYSFMFLSTVPRWYWSPEELFQWENLEHPSRDLWSVGCILGECLSEAVDSRDKYEIERGKVMFYADTYFSQMKAIMKILGTTDLQKDFAGCEKAKRYVLQQEKLERKKMSEIYPNAPEDAIDLLERLLVYNPMKRITALEALQHPFFKELYDSEFGKTQKCGKFSFVSEEKVENKEMQKKMMKEFITFEFQSEKQKHVMKDLLERVQFLKHHGEDNLWRVERKPITLKMKEKDFVKVSKLFLI